MTMLVSTEVQPCSHSLKVGEDTSPFIFFLPFLLPSVAKRPIL